MFYVPALQSASLYQRGDRIFFAGRAGVGARGLDALIEAGGKMQLLVGCTLGQEEVDAIEKGYEVREAVQRCMINQMGAAQRARRRPQKPGLSHLDDRARAFGREGGDPLRRQGPDAPGLGLYHAKMGLITDAAGDQLVYRGSINETTAGWELNVESFDVNCSWESDRDALRVKRSEGEFAGAMVGQGERPGLGRPRCGKRRTPEIPAATGHLHEAADPRCAGG
ncbi:MAG: hypothetical protein R3C45_02160 [Phycisphaerales bacterium]